MANNQSNLSDEDFYYKYIDLISKGYSDDSPEMVELFKSRTTFYSNSSEKQSTVRKRVKPNSQYETQSNNTQYNSYGTTSQQTQAQSQHRIRSGAIYQKRQTASENHSQPHSAKVDSRKYSQNSEHPRTRQSTSTQTNTSNVSSRNKAEYNNTYTRMSTTYTDSRSYLSHIVIDPDSGNYTLLDNQLNVIDSMHSNPLFSFFTQHHKLKKFKKQLKKDFKSYKKSCRKNNKKPNPDFKKMFGLTKYYLKLCPDADYQILELLRNNITRIHPSYANYQTACAEYLYELTQFRDGDPSKLPFDINFCCDKISSYHSYISYRFDPAPDPVQRFKTLYSKKYNLQSEFQSNIRYESKAPNSKFSKVRNVRTTDTRDR